MTITTPARTSRLTGRTVTRASLTATDRDAMFALLSTFFTGVDPATFASDLDEKNHVILLEGEDGLLHGFSTLLVYRTCVAGTDATVVYSGDTIVDREFWGSPALPISWLAATRALTVTAESRVFWLLLTSGFRTYRFLPVFFREFYPRDSSRESVNLVRTIATERFGERYDAPTGIVRFERPQILVPELLDVPEGRTHDEHVAFFLARNPGYTRGDELVCLSDISDANLTAAARRIARRVEALTK
jgi:hypothetical protein